MESHNNSLIEQIRKDIGKTGYPTEVLTASLLDQVEWKTVLGPSYKDESSGLSREFDVRAYRQYLIAQEPQTVTLGIYLMMECKKSDKPWVFFTTAAEGERDSHPRAGQLVQSPPGHYGNVFWSNLAGAEPVIRNDDWQTFHHYFTSTRWAHNYYEPFKNMEKADRSVQIHTAIQSVVNATGYYMRESTVSDQWIRVFYPVIVFDGHLFEAVVRSRDEIDILPAQHVVHKHHFIPKPTWTNERRIEEKTVLIDVVSAASISEYSKMIDLESYTMFELLRIALREGRFRLPG